MKIVIYEGDGNGKFYWRGVSRNGQITCTGHQGYSTKSNAKRAARKTGRQLAFAKVIFE